MKIIINIFKFVVNILQLIIGLMFLWLGIAGLVIASYETFPLSKTALYLSSALGWLFGGAMIIVHLLRKFSNKK